MKNYLLISHGEDMDGLFPEILIKLIVKNGQTVKSLPSNHLNLVSNLIYAINHFKDYDDIFIIDLSLQGENVYPLVNQLSSIHGRIHVIDHHKGCISAINKGYLQPNFSYCKFRNNEKLVSATYLFYEYLKQNFSFRDGINHKTIELLVEAISDWDTGQWSNNKNKIAEKIQMFYLEKNEESLNFLYEFCFKESMFVYDFFETISFEMVNVQMEILRHQILTNSIKVSYKNRTINIFYLPENFNSKYKSICIDYLLNDNTLNLDYLMLADNMSIRIYSKKYNVQEIASAIGIPDDYSKESYAAISIVRYLKSMVSAL